MKKEIVFTLPAEGILNPPARPYRNSKFFTNPIYKKFQKMIETYRSQFLSLKKISLLIFFLATIFSTAFAQHPTNFTSFRTGQDWLADDGLPIDCHGGNIIYVDSLKTFFWYGEHYGQPRGAACYSSKDLYNWKNEGVVMEKGDIEIFQQPYAICLVNRIILLKHSGNFIMVMANNFFI